MTGTMIPQCRPDGILTINYLGAWKYPFESKKWACPTAGLERRSLTDD